MKRRFDWYPKLDRRAFVNAGLLAGAILLFGASSLLAAPLNDKAVGEFSRDLLFGSASERSVAIKALAQRGNADVVASFILAMRYRRRIERDIEVALGLLTGAELIDWHEAMIWQEAHPEIKPHPSYRDVKLEVLRNIDSEFMRFLGGDKSLPENMDIRLEEITWGGVRVDGIPSLDNPKLIEASGADYLLPTDLVFGVAINGDVRAYPLRIMGWHEMFNEVIGGVPVALAYCTLCGAGILFETQVEGRDEPLVFGSSGFLYRSNKLMFDRATDSLWNQFTGEPVSGELHGSGIKLKIRPVAITSWERWSDLHPETKVLNVKTGFYRDYGSGVVYNDYFSSPDLMFPAFVGDESRVRRKDYVFGMRDFGVAKAWPVDLFEGGAVINDTLGDKPLVLAGDAATRTVRAYYSEGLIFKKGDKEDELKGPDGTWHMGEDALLGPDGRKLARAPGHIAFWFAWDGYLGAASELVAAKP